MSAEIARGVNTDWMKRKYEHRQSICGQKQAEDFLKKHCTKKAGDSLSLSRNQLRIMTGLQRRHCHLRVQTFRLGLVKNSPKCDRCKQASETASHVFVTVRPWTLFDLGN